MWSGSVCSESVHTLRSTGQGHVNTVLEHYLFCSGSESKLKWLNQKSEFSFQTVNTVNSGKIWVGGPENLRSHDGT